MKKKKPPNKATAPKHSAAAIRQAMRLIPPNALRDVIPPRSLVRLVKADRSTPAWRDKIGSVYRVGYYNPFDGLNTIWLVEDDGEYSQTVPQHCILDYFKVERRSTETDLFGINRRRLGPRRVPNKGVISLF